jgi:hypothetical protein
MMTTPWGQTFLQPECHASYGDIGCDLLVHHRFAHQDRSDVIHDFIVALARAGC